MFRGIALVDAITGVFGKQKLKGVDGAAQFVGGAFAKAIYSDATYKYTCEAAPGAVLTDAVWRVNRETLATGRIQWADGNGNFDNVATDIATVAAFTFV